MRGTAVVVALLLAAAATPAGANKRSLSDALRAEAGKAPVYLTAGADGVWARAAGSKWSRRLVTGAVEIGAYDPALELIWLLRKGGKLEVIDLRRAAAKPVLIARGVPTRPLSIKRGDTTVDSHWISVASVTLDWSSESTLQAMTGDDDDRAALEAEAAGMKIIGQRWLEANLDRRPVREPPARRSLSETPRTGLPAGAACTNVADWDPDWAKQCGRAVALAGYELIVVRYDCGYFVCDHSCVLYDPKTRKLASVVDSSHWGDAAPERHSCFRQRVAAGEKFFLFNDQIDDSVCRVGGTCTKLTDDALGWLDGGIDLLP